MTKKELYTLMDLIQAYYEKFHFDQNMLDAWYMVLQKYSYEKVHVNRSSEIFETNLAAKALREGSIFFEPLKEGRNAKKLILDMKEEEAEIMLEN